MRARLAALLLLLLGNGEALAQSSPRPVCNGVCGTIQQVEESGDENEEYGECIIE